ncbi:hypothetical protein L195_g019872, partial [Trifolium pratense]
GTKEDTPNTVAISSVIASVVLLIIADIGRRRSRSSLLRLYAVLSFLANLLFTASLANQYSLLKWHNRVANGCRWKSVVELFSVVAVVFAIAA